MNSILNLAKPWTWT